MEWSTVSNHIRTMFFIDICINKKEFEKKKNMLYIIRSKTFENTGETDTGL